MSVDELLIANAQTIERDLRDRCQPDLDKYVIRSICLVAAQIGLMLDLFAKQSACALDQAAMMVRLTDHLLTGIDLLGGMKSVEGTTLHALYAAASAAAECLLDNMSGDRACP